MLQTTTLVTGGRTSAAAPFALIALKPAQMRPQMPPMRQSKRGRTFVAWIVAAGLGLSAALYPLPRDMKLLELFPPGDRATDSSQIGLHSGDFSALSDIDLMAFEGAALSDVVHLGELLSSHPDLPVDALFDIVHAYGLPGAVTLLGSLLPSGYPGGGYVLAASGGGNTSALPALLRLLEYLQHAPAVSVGALSAVVTKVLPAMLQSLGVTLASATSAIPAPGPAAAEAPPAAPDPGTSESFSSPAPESPAAAPTAEPASPAAPDPLPQPTPTQVSSVTEVTSSASSVTNDGLLTSDSRLSSGEVKTVSGGLDAVSTGTSSGNATSGTGSGTSVSISADPGGVGSTGGSTAGGTTGGSTTGGGSTSGGTSGGGSTSGGTTGGGGSGGQ